MVPDEIAVLLCGQRAVHSVGSVLLGLITADFIRAVLLLVLLMLVLLDREGLLQTAPLVHDDALLDLVVLEEVVAVLVLEELGLLHGGAAVVVEGGRLEDVGLLHRLVEEEVDLLAHQVLVVVV